ncbi:LAME_0F18074g1_1 [Lachancea meyersii CBS 8951]|uniref:LAME_0F18074g1_1 n=1 Tax=Lachancea meyersii CBS 8951 TaxID=1266667 RepID=A0A1G4K0F1_9SACH|nr:LAME_0F18074g1_1 [Lachancea meyersii CBS 8951]
MVLQIQVDTASSSSNPSATVSYAFLGGSSGGILSLDQSQMLSATAVSSFPRFSRSASPSSGTESLTSTLSGAISSSTGASSSVPKTTGTSTSASTSTSTSASQAASSTASVQSSSAAGYRAPVPGFNGPNWKLGTAITLLAVCGALTV